MIVPTIRSSPMNKAIFLLGFATLFGFGTAGVLVVEFYQERSFFELLLNGWKLHHQLWMGGLSGLMASGLALLVITRRFFEKEEAYYSGMISKLGLDLKGIVFLSLCAGIGEEIFFRAAIQPFLGIGGTSLLFVLLHGYLSPRNIRISIYGVVMVLIVIGFGYLFKFIGIFSAIVAHSVLDMVLFWRLTRRRTLST